MSFPQARSSDVPVVPREKRSDRRPGQLPRPWAQKPSGRRCCKPPRGRRRGLDATPRCHLRVRVRANIVGMVHRARPHGMLSAFNHSRRHRIMQYIYNAADASPARPPRGARGCAAAPAACGGCGTRSLRGPAAAPRGGSAQLRCHYHGRLARRDSSASPNVCTSLSRPGFPIFPQHALWPPKVFPRSFP